MTERRHPGRTIAVEEVRLDATDGRAAATPAGPPRDGGHRRRASLLVVAVVGALAAGATTVAVVDPGDDEDVAATSTTSPQPIVASSGDERRVLLTQPPPGFHLAAVSESEGAPVQPRATATLHARPGASVDHGEWLLAVFSPAAARLPLDVGFRRPARTTSIGSAAGVVGHGSLGQETTAFDHPDGRVTLIARGLVPGTTEALARHARVEDAVVQVAAADLPAGFVEHTVWRLPPGLLIAQGLAADSGPADGWHASYRAAADGAAIDVAVSSLTAEEAQAVAPISRFVLADPVAVTVRAHAAIVGRAGESIWVVWTEGGSLVTVSLTGVDMSAAVELAGAVRLGSDAGWDEAVWSAIGPAERGELTMRIVGRGTLSGATSWWDVTAAIDGGELLWALRTGHNAAESIEQRVPITAPLTLIATGHQMFTRDPIGADAGEMSDWYAVAVVVGDGSLTGARMRLTTDGPAPAMSEAVLDEVRGIDGYVIAALALPWTDHYTVEVIGPNGEVLASATDTDDA